MTVNMPKFDTEYSVYLTDALKAMGMTDAFDPDLADLTGAGRGVDGPLYISYVFQRVKVDVDEEPGLAQRFGIMSIPTLVAMQDGRPVGTLVGVQPKARVLELLGL